jgi:hypothetical protein
MSHSKSSENKMHKTLITITFLYFISNEASADRLGNSTFAKGVITNISNCKNKNAGVKSSVTIKTKAGQTIQGSINSHTRLSDECSRFKKGVQVVVGYAEGDDTSAFSNGYQIIDSISIK